MYANLVNTNGQIIKTAVEVRQEVETVLVGLHVDAALAKSLATDGARPGYDGNALHLLAIGGQLIPTNIETFAALVRQHIPPTLAERIATESTAPLYDAALVRDLANNGYLTSAMVIDLLSLGPARHQSVTRTHSCRRNTPSMRPTLASLVPGIRRTEMPSWLPSKLMCIVRVLSNLAAPVKQML